MDEENNNPNIKSPDEIVIEETETTAEPVKTEPVTELKPKKRVGLSILITILILLLIGGALAIGYLWGNNTTKPTDNTAGTNNSTASNEPTTGEVELADATLKKDINNKIAWLLRLGTNRGDMPDGEEEFIAKFAYETPVDYVYGNTMSDDFKLMTVLYELSRYFSEVHINLTPKEYQIAKTLLEQDKGTYAGLLFNKSTEDIIREGVKMLNAEAVSKYYYDLFGENLVHRAIKGFNCNTFYYSEETDSYISFPSFGCGGTSAGYDYLNREKYTIDGDTVYVYYRVGSDKAAGSISNDLLFQNGEIIGDAIDMTQSDSIDKLKTDMKNNPSKYSYYRLVFEKNDKGTYSFKRAEKIE